MTSMRLPLAALALVALAGRPAGAEVDPPSKWVEWKDAKVGLTVLRPKAAKVATKGNVVTISAADFPTVTITVEATDEHSTYKNGGHAMLRVEWELGVPLRHARCVADAADVDQAVLASKLCESITLAPAPKHPHLEVTVTSHGLADEAAYKKAVAAAQPALDACWRAALAKDADLPEGELTFARTYTGGAAARSSRSLQNFFDHDAKPLGACVFDKLAAIPARLAGADADVTIDAICYLY